MGRRSCLARSPIRRASEARETSIPSKSWNSRSSRPWKLPPPPQVVHKRGGCRPLSARERSSTPGARPLPARFGAWLVCLASLAAAGGCSPSRSAGDYIPSTARSRQWLEQALTKWREGRAEAAFGTAPAIQFADAQAQAGRKLVEFSIVGELPVDGGRRFQVRVTFDDPPESLKRQYVVFGIDPIWVVDQESLDMITHWDHPMTAPPPTAETREDDVNSPDRPAREPAAPTTKEE